MRMKFLETRFGKRPGAGPHGAAAVNAVGGPPARTTASTRKAIPASESSPAYLSAASPLT